MSGQAVCLSAIFMPKGGTHVYQHMQIYPQGCELPALYRVCEKAGLHLVVAQSPLISVSADGENCDRSLAPPLPTKSATLRGPRTSCPWLAERIEAGVVGYREAVMETFPRDRRLSSRLNLLIKHYPGSLWSNEQHERRMQYQCAVQGYRRRRDTNAYYAAMYLLTSNDDIYRRTANCFCKDGIEFGYAMLKNTSPHNYALFMAARDLCGKTEAVTMADLAEPEVIDPEALRLIVNATLIARYGLAAFQIRARGAEYER